MTSYSSHRLQHPPELTGRYREKIWAYTELSRLHRYPVGINLLTQSTLWSLTLAARRVALPLIDLAVLSVMITIAFVFVHSAACVFNDICDVEIDRQVERSKRRPLVTGRASLRGAWMLLSFWIFATLLMLSLVKDQRAIRLGLFGLFPLHTLYPLMKRWTYWTQVWLGITMNWGVLVAWLVVIPGDYSSVDPVILLLGTVCWSVVYDTEYACQDVRDDVRAGVHSTALLFGTKVKPILAAFATVFVASLIVAGKLNGQGPIYYLVSVGGSAGHFTWQLLTWRVDLPESCGKVFRANYHLGFLIWFGLVFDYALHVYQL